MTPKLLHLMLLIFNQNALVDISQLLISMINIMKKRKSHLKVHIYFYMKNKEQIQSS